MLREVELRLDGKLSKDLFQKMDKGLFEDAVTTRIRERGCVRWTGPETNVNAKVRKRSTGEATVKITGSANKVVPGYRLDHACVVRCGHGRDQVRCRGEGKHCECRREEVPE